MTPRLPFPVALTLLLLATAALFLTRLGDRALTSEEVRWATVAREMRASGDPVHPTINGSAYYDKPVGSYWLIVAASGLTGGVTETAARLPAALAGVLGVGLLVGLARRLTDDGTALLAGAILATSFGFVVYARRATADVETVVGVLAAVSLYQRNAPRPGRAWVLVLWAVMAVTSLTKGLLGFALPLAVIGVDTLSLAFAGRRETGFFAGLKVHGRWVFNPWTLVAVPLAVAVYFVPFLLSAGGGPAGAGMANGLAMVWRENVQRFVAPHNHVGPVYLYAGVIFVLAAPWSAFLPAALVPPVRRNPGDRFARVYFWTVFAFFTLAASRRSYYLLPVLPAAALLIAGTLTALPQDLRGLARRLRGLGWAVLTVAVVASGLALVPPAWVLPAPYDTVPRLPYPAAFAVGWLAALAVVGLGLCGRLPRPAGFAAVIAFAAFGYGFTVAWPAVDDQRTRRSFLADVVARTAGDPDRLAVFHARDSVFELGRTAPDYADGDRLAADLLDGRVRWVLARRRYLAGVNLPANIVLEEAVRPWDGDQVGDKLVLLEVTSPAGP